MAAERVSYREAGAAMRNALGRARDADLSLCDRKVLDAVFAATVSYSKLSDRLPLVQIAEAAACSTRQARRSLQRLSELGVVVYVPGRGSGNLSVVGLAEERGPLAVRFPAVRKGDRASTKKGTATRARVRTEKVLPEKGTPSISPPSLSLVLRGEVLEQEQVLAVRVLAAFNEQAQTRFEATRWCEMIGARLREHPEITFEEHRAIIERNLAAPWWDTLSPNVIYANPAQFERAMHADGRRRRRSVDDTLRWLDSLKDETADDNLSLGSGLFTLSSPSQNQENG